MSVLRWNDQRRDCGSVRRHHANRGARLGQGAGAAPRRARFVRERSPSERMTREQWLRLEPLVDAALDLAPDQRPAFYAEVATNRPELLAHLESFLRRVEDEDELFDSAAAERFAALLDGEQVPRLAVDVLPQLQASLDTAYTV